MDDEHKENLKNWKETMKLVVDPVLIMEDLPDIFDVNSDSYKSVLEKRQIPHQAIDELIKQLLRSEKIDVYKRFLETIGRHYLWLLPSSNGKIEYSYILKYREYVNQFITRIMPHITEVVKVQEISQDLQTGDLLSREESERVECEERYNGMTAGVRMLVGVLVRSKHNDWPKTFKSILRQKKYSSDLLDILDDLPTDPEDLMNCCENNETSESTEHIIGKKEYANDAVGMEKGEVPDKKDFVNDAVKPDELHGAMHYPTNKLGLPSFYVSYVPVVTSNTNYGSLIDFHSMNISQPQMFSPNLDTTVPKETADRMVSEEELVDIPAPKVNPQLDAPIPTNAIIPRQAFYGQHSTSPEKDCTATSCSSDMDMGFINGDNIIICGPETPYQRELIINNIKHRYPSIVDFTGRKIIFLFEICLPQHKRMKSDFAAEKWRADFYDQKYNRRLDDMMQTSEIILMTCQLLNTILYEGSNKITDFDLLIFDNCDIVSKEGPCRQILLDYLTQLNSHNIPQLLGLSTSLGYGKICKEIDANDYVITLSAFFNARGGIYKIPPGMDDKSTKRTSKSTIKKDGSKSENNNISDRFTLCLCECIGKIIDLIYKPPHEVKQIKIMVDPRKIGKGTNEYLDWCRLFSEKYENADVTTKQRKKFRDCADFLTIFNQALLVSYRCRTKQTICSLEKALQNKLRIVDRDGDNNNSAVESHLKSYSKEALDVLHFYCKQLRATDQTIDAIETEVLGTFRKHKNAKVLVVVDEVLLVQPLTHYFNELKSLRPYSVEAKCFELTGTRHTRTTSENRRVSDAFISGNTKVLVCMENEASQLIPFSNFVISYDCQSPTNPCQNDGRPLPTPRFMSYSFNPPVANDKVKIVKPVLMEKAVEYAEKMRRENFARYQTELGRKQRKLLADHARNSQVRQTIPKTTS